MNQDQWRKSITLWVVIGCLTAVSCAWILRPIQFEHRYFDGFGLVVFDNRDGSVSRPAGIESIKAAEP